MDSEGLGITTKIVPLVGFIIGVLLLVYSRRVSEKGWLIFGPAPRWFVIFLGLVFAVFNGIDVGFDVANFLDSLSIHIERR